MAYLPTLDDLIQDLQLAKEISIKNENVNGLINSVMSQAKLLGIDSGSTIETSKPEPITVTVQHVDARKYDDT